MYLIGLTGGIAAGKTTVAQRLVLHGAVEIDADLLARKAVEPGSPALDKIRQTFGADIVDKSGTLDRAKLADLVFSDSEARRALEAIVHPEVRRLAQEELAQQSKRAIVVYSVPLLVEADVDLPFDLLVTVEAPQDAQIHRMMTHRNMTEPEARARVEAQATPAMRANRSDVILNSNQSLPKLLDDVDHLWEKIASAAAAKETE